MYNADYRRVYQFEWAPSRICVAILKNFFRRDPEGNFAWDWTCAVSSVSCYHSSDEGFAQTLHEKSTEENLSLKISFVNLRVLIESIQKQQTLIPNRKFYKFRGRTTQPFPQSYRLASLNRSSRGVGKRGKERRQKKRGERRTRERREHEGKRGQ